MPTQTKTATTVSERLIPSALLAPSAHNTQPWQFSATDNQVEVFVDWSRHLSISDPTLRQLYVSLGCAITNLLVAARHLDLSPNLALFPDGQGNQAAVARIMLEPAAGSQPTSLNGLFNAIESRRTDRSIFDAEPLTVTEKASLPTYQDENVFLIEDRAKINHIGELTKQATLDTLSDKEFKSELSNWVRHNWTRQDDGMPGYAMGIPGPVSLLASTMVRVAPIHKQEGPKTSQQIRSASAIAVIATPGDTPADWVTAGQLLQQLWLEVTAAELGAAPLVAAIEAGSQIREQLRQAINTDQYPQSILRIGHSEQTNIKATPRRPVAACLK